MPPAEVRQPLQSWCYAQIAADHFCARCSRNSHRNKHPCPLSNK